MGDRVKLPAPVVDRLGDAGLSAVRTRSGAHLLEARMWSGVEIRSTADGPEVRVVGYASTYDQPYPIWGGARAGGFDETIAAGAFDKSVSEQDDVRFLVNHDGVPLARTKSGTLSLEADDVGLLVDADLDPTSPIVIGLRSAMQRGDMDQMSFAFEVTRQTWSPDYSQRSILEVRLFDVSVVTYPANDQTMALVGADALRPAVDAPPAVAGRCQSPDLARAGWYRLARSA
jgi:hypothetical protein